MRRQITISIPTDDEDVRLIIQPTGLNTVLMKPEAQYFAVSSNELIEALKEAEKYRKEFADKEKAEEGKPSTEKFGPTPPEEVEDNDGSIVFRT